MKNKLQDVRNLLIEQMELLSDPKEKCDMERIKMMNEIGKTLVESAKAEAGYIKSLPYAAKFSPTGFVAEHKQLSE